MTEALYGANVTEGILSELDTGYETLRNSHQVLLSEIFQQEDTTPVNFIPEDPILPLSNYSPTTNLLYDPQQIIRANPALVMRQMLSEINEVDVTESDIIQDSSNNFFHAATGQFYEAPKEWIASSLRTGYYDMPYEVGYSVFEDLYYVYLYDAREALVASAIYFRFDGDGILSSIGFDSISYNPYEITALLDSGAYLSLDTVSSVPFRTIEDVLLPMLGAAPEGQPAVQLNQKLYTHRTEKQFYYAGTEESKDALLAIRTMEWYTYMPDIQYS